MQNKESKCIMKEEAEKAIRELETGKSSGSDDITTAMMLKIIDAKRVPEAYIKIIQDMYEDCETQKTTREGNTEYRYFKVKVGLHQGSAISPLLFFIIIMDVLASEIDKEPPWAMLFADDLVLCETSKAAVERELGIWRDQFERHGLRVSRTKTA